MSRTSSHIALDLRELDGWIDPLRALEHLRGDGWPWLLDSAAPSDRLGRFSFVGADPYLVLRAFGSRVELECRRGVRPGLRPGTSQIEQNPLEVVRSLLPRIPLRDAPSPIPFLAGAVGVLGYELASWTEGVELFAHDDLELPDLALLFVDRVLAVDHVAGRAWVSALGFGESEAEAAARARRAGAELARRLPRCAGAAPPASTVQSAVRGRDGAAPRTGRFLSRSDHEKAVEQIRDEIALGRLYQANLTYRMDVPYCGDPWRLYIELRRRNPAPFGAYLELPDVTVLSTSPERFARVSPEGRVESRPIKGTRPRGNTPAEDAALRAELAASEKDRAENLMIVDLVRNDLGRVCELGSIEVSELQAIEPYATVFQMVSTVEGRLAPGRDVVDLLRASFPPGSMTGAPKIAAMELIDRLEPVRRGLYSGALGYFDVRGGADLSVVIRTLLVRDGSAHLHVGGGIVIDSEPEAEYRETLDKVQALLAALERG